MAVATATRRRAGVARTRTARTRLLGYILVAPAILYILALVAVPFFLALSYSVRDVTVSNLDGAFVGLKNYGDLLGDPAFRQSLRNTVVYTVASIVINSILGTFLAFILLSNFRGKRVIRFLILLPWTIPIALTILSWKWMFHPQYSVINWAAKGLGLLANTYGVQWLGQPVAAMIAVITVNVWRNFPFTAIVLLAGLTSIPPEIIDASRLDGAGPFTRYRSIIVPMIAPILFIGLLFNLVFTITDLTIVYMLTQGGPANATQVLGTYAFQVGIVSGDLSHGAATTLFLFPALLVFAIIFLRQVRKREI